MSRKMARIEIIEELTPIEGADKIELARIGGWRVVVMKGLYGIGDKVVYFEVDSLLPDNELFEGAAGRDGLKDSMDFDTMEISKGYRLKCIRLRGVYSQGLAIPVDVVAQTYPAVASKNVGEDLTDLIGIKVYERPVRATAGSANAPPRGNFPSYIRKTDQERAQNMKSDIFTSYLAGEKYQVSVKLDGSSMTVWRKDGELGIASRRLSLKLEGTSNFVVMGNTVHNNEKVSEIHGDYCFQGELIAPSIQGNFEGVSNPEYHVYSMFDMNEHSHVNPLDVYELCDRLGVNHVPVLFHASTLAEIFGDGHNKNSLVDAIVKYADGPSAMNGKMREGLVFKSLDSDLTFKAVGERYLTKQG